MAWAISALLASCQSKKPPAAPPVEVEVTSVVERDVPLYGEWVATLDGYVNAQIQPQVTGYVVSQNYKEGSVVRKGQLLFQIDMRPFQALLDQAEAQLAEDEAQAGKVQHDVERETPLAAENAIPQQELDDDTHAYLAAEAAVKAAQAQVDQAQLNLDFTHVTSLIDGIAGIAQVQIGNLVTPSTTLTTVSQVNPIKAYVPISEQQYLHFATRINAQTQQKVPSNAPSVELVLADGTVYPHRGILLETNRQVDVTTGSIEVVCSFPNPDHILRPGEFGRVRAAPDTSKHALLVPQKAVIELQGTYSVAVVDSDNKVALRPITVGEQVDTMWIIDKGVRPGERVVVEGVQKVRDGSLVTIKPSTPVTGGDTTKSSTPLTSGD